MLGGLYLRHPELHRPAHEIIAALLEYQFQHVRHVQRRVQAIRPRAVVTDPHRGLANLIGQRRLGAHRPGEQLDERPGNKAHGDIDGFFFATEPVVDGATGHAGLVGGSRQAEALNSGPDQCLSHGRDDGFRHLAARARRLYELHV
ncbi:Uncharacterised protein [Mycobacteroides abscessus subsp. abscessus]|nr:Uncharacterised protein [Mycobacteroides abscessus subsp. abscessus]